VAKLKAQIRLAWLNGFVAKWLVLSDGLNALWLNINQLVFINAWLAGWLHASCFVRRSDWPLRGFVIRGQPITRSWCNDKPSS
jgi:hypothetical protein